MSLHGLYILANVCSGQFMQFSSIVTMLEGLLNIARPSYFSREPRNLVIYIKSSSFECWKLIQLLKNNHCVGQTSIGQNQIWAYHLQLLRVILSNVQSFHLDLTLYD